MIEDKKNVLKRYNEALNLAEQLYYELNDCLNCLSNYSTELKKAFTINEQILDDGRINDSMSEIIDILKILNSKVVYDLKVAASKQKRLIESSN